MFDLMPMAARNPVPPELADATPVVARPRPVAKPGFPGCWVEVNPPRTTETLHVEGLRAQCDSSRLMGELVVQMSCPGDAEGTECAEGTLAAALAASPLLMQPRPQGVEGHPDLRALLHDEQRVSLRDMGEFTAKAYKEAWATPGLVAQSSSVPDPAAAPCEGAQ